MWSEPPNILFFFSCAIDQNWSEKKPNSLTFNSIDAFNKNCDETQIFFWKFRRAYANTPKNNTCIFFDFCILFYLFIDISWNTMSQRKIYGQNFIETKISKINLRTSFFLRNFFLSKLAAPINLDRSSTPTTVY